LGEEFFSFTLNLNELKDSKNYCLLVYVLPAYRSNCLEFIRGDIGNYECSRRNVAVYA
jgi:hypothetical protein